MTHLLPPLLFETTLITVQPEQLHSHFLQKDQTWLSPLCLSVFFLYLPSSLWQRSEGRKWNLWLAYYESTTSLLTVENRSKSFESCIIILKKNQKVCPSLWAVSEIRVQKNVPAHQSDNIIVSALRCLISLWYLEL